MGGSKEEEILMKQLQKKSNIFLEHFNLIF